MLNHFASDGKCIDSDSTTAPSEVGRFSAIAAIFARVISRLGAPQLTVNEPPAENLPKSDAGGLELSAPALLSVMTRVSGPETLRGPMT
jgi:hypothetical protein